MIISKTVPVVYNFYGKKSSISERIGLKNGTARRQLKHGRANKLSLRACLVLFQHIVYLTKILVASSSGYIHDSVVPRNGLLIIDIEI
jgi:hypothetical protein